MVILDWYSLHYFMLTILPRKKVDRIYLSTPNKIAIIDHEKKRTFVLRKEGLPDAGILILIFISVSLYYLLYLVNSGYILLPLGF